MIVDEEHVATALAYLNLDPHPIALARKDVADAENKAKRIYAEAFLAAEGTEYARKSAAEKSPDHISAKAEETEAILDLENHRAKVKGAEMLCEIWRSEQANTRKLDRF